ncbi:MAG: response regulator transcription factor [Segetibacter sp.]|nr:response regulator transcription factor [Segetibacter sp.]
MIKVGIVEDNEAYRKALHILLSKTNDIEVVYSAENCDHIVANVTDCVDVLIMDIEMPGISGIEGVRLLKEQCPDTNIFMLTTYDDEKNIFEAIKAGAMGYLLKKDPPDEIINAVRKAYNGETVMNGKIARKVLQYFSQKEEKKDVWKEYNLTAREKEILLLLMDGLAYKEIAAKCFISLDTIFSHIRKIYSKLNVHSRAEISAKFR